MPLVTGQDIYNKDLTCLGFVNYDPGTAVTKSAGTLIAMTAFDTTNLRITFTAPASGFVYVRIVATLTSGGSTYPSVLFGVLESSTVVFRASPIGGLVGQLDATRYVSQEVLGVVAVSAGSHTFDAAYGVEVAVGTTAVKYGGPNNATGQDAWGALQFEVWSIPAVVTVTPTLIWQPPTTSTIYTR